jgi:hypothetical protein
MGYMVNEVAEAGYCTDLHRELAQIDELRKAKEESALHQGDPWVQMGKSLFLWMDKPRKPWMEQDCMNAFGAPHYCKMAYGNKPPKRSD